ncbi:MAG: DUF4301 family protein [Crocinitomicaceae bacterium]
MDDQLKRQQEQLQEEPVLNVVDVCSPLNGILQFSEEERGLYADVSFPANTCFFIPASGSGSRMFGFLFQFLVDGIETGDVRHFFKNLEQFPFFEEMKERLGDAYSAMTRKEIVEFLLSDEGMSLASIPKGMVPFHSLGSRTLKPFQEHCLQFSELSDDVNIHYTVQKDSLDLIKGAVAAVTTDKLEIEYSFQDPSTDAYCFDKDGQPASIDGELIRRPAGHGALLKNLNNLDAELVCVKNIDNIQPTGRHQLSLNSWKMLYGLLDSFQKDLFSLADNYSIEALQSFNTRFEVFREEELSEITAAHIHAMCDRPTRVCGMVVNEGAPGGGPFWVEYEGVATKQIVEKVQLPKDEKTAQLLEKSTHFNPVFIVMNPRTVNGERVDLNKFIDRNAFIRVEKDHKGQHVVYHELPGLWNGSMAFWNTLFVEVPKEVFTPVKTVLDLIGKDHLI